MRGPRPAGSWSCSSRAELLAPRWHAVLKNCSNSRTAEAAQPGVCPGVGGACDPESPVTPFRRLWQRNESAQAGAAGRRGVEAEAGIERSTPVLQTEQAGAQAVRGGPADPVVADPHDQFGPADPQFDVLPGRTRV